MAVVLGAALLAGCASTPTMKRDDMSSFDRDHYQ
jgi:outer membrane murein-binding lipoprotein Lpp